MWDTMKRLAHHDLHGHNIALLYFQLALLSCFQSLLTEESLIVIYTWHFRDKSFPLQLSLT